MHVPTHAPRWKVVQDGILSSLIAVISMVRGLLLFLSGRPRTPLRVLCIMAFDTLHLLRSGKRLSTLELKVLAALLDFGACVNAAFDQKEVAGMSVVSLCNCWRKRESARPWRNICEGLATWRAVVRCRAETVGSFKK